MLSVFLPAWIWTWKPTAKFMCITYDDGMSKRDARKMRLIIQSPEYQNLWGDTTALQPDRNQADEFYNRSEGFRFSTSIGGRLTGEGADYLIVDDPHNARDQHSSSKMNEVEQFWRDALSSRFNHEGEQALIVCHQRMANNDLTAVILEEDDPDLVHFSLPARYDPRLRRDTKWAKDPRKILGEPLWPEKWSERYLDKLASRMTSFGYNAQYQQDPMAAGGQIIRRDYWQVWALPRLPEIHHIILSVDCAGKDAVTSDYSACTVWGTFIIEDEPGFNLLLLASWMDRLQFTDLINRIRMTIEDHTYDDVPPEWVLIEEKSAGMQVIQSMTDAGVEGIVPYNPGQDSKQQRVWTAETTFRAGKVWVLGRPQPTGGRSAIQMVKFADDVVKQCEQFPKGENDDLVDTVAQAVHFYRNGGYVQFPDDEEEDDDEIRRKADSQHQRRSLYG